MDERSPSVLADTSPGDVARSLSLGSIFIRGTAAFGIASAAQRVPSYLGALIAARNAGPEVMGIYATCIATASLVASYAGFSIGSVATRFGADRENLDSGFPGFVRVFTPYCFGVAAAAGLLGAVLGGVLSRSLFNEAPFREVILLGGGTAASFVLLDGVTGLLIGTLRFKAIVLMSSLVGAFTFAALIIGSQVDARSMVLAHSAAMLIPTSLCLMILRLRAPKPDERESQVRISHFVRFGALQLGGNLALGLASWFVVASLVNHDTTGRSVGLYSIGQQLNSLALLLPSLTVQLVLPLVMRLKGNAGEQLRAVAVASFSSMALALPIGGLLLLGAPTFVDAYGKSFGAGSKAAGLLVAAAIVSVSTASIGNAILGHNARIAMLVNVGGAACLTALSFALIPRFGPTGAAAAWLGMYLLFSFAWQVVARHFALLPNGFTSAWAITGGTTLVSALLSFARAEGTAPEITLLQMGVTVVGTWGVLRLGRSRGHLPNLKSLIRTTSSTLRRQHP